MLCKGMVLKYHHCNSEVTHTKSTRVKVSKYLMLNVLKVALCCFVIQTLNFIFTILKVLFLRKVVFCVSFSTRHVLTLFV